MNNQDTSLYSLYGLLGFILFGFLWALYFQYVDGYMRKWKEERNQKEMNNNNILLQEIVRLLNDKKWKVPERIESLLSRVNLQPLTDEEIHKVFRDTWDSTTNPNCIFTAFARAILKKASEK